MTLDRSRQPVQGQAGFGVFANGNAVRLSLAEVARGHGQEAVDRLIRVPELDRVFGVLPGTMFEGGPAMASRGSDLGRWHKLPFFLGLIEEKRE